MTTYGPLDSVPVGNEIVTAPMGHPLWEAAHQGPVALVEYRRGTETSTSETNREGEGRTQ